MFRRLRTAAWGQKQVEALIPRGLSELGDIICIKTSKESHWASTDFRPVHVERKRPSRPFLPNVLILR